MPGLGSTANAAQAYISLSCYLNPQGSSSQQNIIGYRSSDTLNAAPPSILTVEVPVSTTSQFALATLLAAFDAPIWLSVQEVAASGAGLGFLISTTASGFIGIAANGFFAMTLDGATALPTLHVTNSSATTVLVLSIGVLAQ